MKETEWKGDKMLLIAFGFLGIVSMIGAGRKKV